MLSPSSLLDAWEREATRPASARGTALLAAAWPGHPDRDWRKEPIGVRDVGLLELRRTVFGDTMVGLVTCPDCSTEYEVSFSARSMLDDTVAADRETWQLASEGYRLEVRSLRVADLDVALRAPDLPTARRELLRCAVVQAAADDGPMLFDDLPPEALDAVEQSLADADPDADMSLGLRCTDCDATWEEPFDIATFFWAEVQAWVARTVEDVHRLARSYGWSERDVLRMSERRRRTYLELAEK